MALDDVRQIREIVASINQAWVIGDFDAIGQYVAEHVVMAPPGDEQRVLGRAAYVASFRHFTEVAKTHEFNAGLAHVDIIGTTAVAVCPFTIAYEIEGEKYREKGSDLLVFALGSGVWKVVWRTLTSEPQPVDEAPQQA